MGRQQGIGQCCVDTPVGGGDNFGASALDGVYGRQEDAARKIKAFPFSQIILDMPFSIDYHYNEF